MKDIGVFTAHDGKPIILRPAIPDDARDIIDTVKSMSLERSYTMAEKYGKTEENEKQYIRDMNRSRNLLLVALYNDRIIGSFAALQMDSGFNPKTAHILNIGLHIKEGFREIGIGTQMLKYSITWAHEHGFKKMEASIFTVNKRSLNLFRHAGFIEEGLRTKQFRIGSEYIDEVLMGKLLL